MPSQHPFLITHSLYHRGSGQPPPLTTPITLIWLWGWHHATNNSEKRPALPPTPLHLHHCTSLTQSLSQQMYLSDNTSVLAANTAHTTCSRPRHVLRPPWCPSLGSLAILPQLGQQGGHLNGGHSRLPALVPHLAARPVQSLWGEERGDGGEGRGGFYVAQYPGMHPGPSHILTQIILHGAPPSRPPWHPPAVNAPTLPRPPTLTTYYLPSLRPAPNPTAPCYLSPAHPPLKCSSHALSTPITSHLLQVVGGEHTKHHGHARGGGGVQHAAGCARHHGVVV